MRHVVDMFCGAGGLSLGFRDAGFTPVYAVDSDPAAVSTYTRNLGAHAVVRDVRAMTGDSIRDELGTRDLRVDVVTGGPPCQGFSVQRRGSDSDHRNHLVLEYVRLVLELRPALFLMENVGGLLSVRGRPYMDELQSRVHEAGYFLQVKKLNAADYGVPQDRRRVFLVGEMTQGSLPRFRFPEPHAGHEQRRVSVRQAIHDLMGLGEDDVANHRGDRLSTINLERIRALKAGEGRDSLPAHLQLDCHRRNNGHRHLDVYGRMSWEGPAPTITARFDSFSRGRFGHPELDRTITLREGARLQGFPDSFVFDGSKVEVARQIGNAVPPPLARAIAEEMWKALASA